MIILALCVPWLLDIQKNIQKSTPNIILVSFGNEKFYKSLRLLSKEATDLNFFSHIRFYTDHDLKSDAEFWSQHGEFIESHHRGYGYWIWKPYIIMKTCLACNPGDIIIYVDGGCSLNKDATDTLREYVDMLLSHPDTWLAPTLLTNYREEEWTKADLLKYLDYGNTTNKTMGHIEAGVVMLRNSDRNLKFLQDWFDTATKDNYMYVNDDASIEPNSASFREHRHDQSIYSLLLKKYLNDGHANIIILPDELGVHGPIWDERRILT